VLTAPTTIVNRASGPDGADTELDPRSRSSLSRPTSGRSLTAIGSSSPAHGHGVPGPCGYSRGGGGFISCRWMTCLLPPHVRHITPGALAFKQGIAKRARVPFTTTIRNFHRQWDGGRSRRIATGIATLDPL
jgi:hypothetical protein